MDGGGEGKLKTKDEERMQADGDGDEDEDGACWRCWSALGFVYSPVGISVSSLRTFPAAVAAVAAAAAPSNCNIRDSDIDISSACHRYLRRVDCIFLSGCVHYVSVCVCARLMHFSLLCGCEYLNTLVSLKMSSRCCPDPHCKLFAYRWLLSQWLVTAAV